MLNMNWTKLIKELNELGISQSAIARAVGLSQPSVNMLAAGKTKRVYYEEGVALLALYKKVIKNNALARPS
jgi:predicted XRE-type DNA-binding protein